MNISEKDKLTLKIIDTWLDYSSRYSTLPGLQVCIRKKGNLIYSKAFGVSNLKTKEKLTTAHIFRIASQSKSFTSCAVLKLIEAGRLHFEDKIIQYIPELKNHKDKRFKLITIRDLLSHRAGLLRDGRSTEYWELTTPFLTKNQLIAEFMASDLVYDPNVIMKYTNNGYGLLGILIEKVTSMSFSKAMNELVFKELPGTKLFTDFIDEEVKYFATGHTRAFYEGKCSPLKHAPANALAPASGLCGNAEDTSRFFDKFILGTGLVKKDMQKELLSLSWPVKNTKERYGYGLLFETIALEELVGHSGSYPGFATRTVSWAGQGMTISCFMNTNYFIPKHVTNSIVRMFKKVHELFSDRQAQETLVSLPLMTKWGGHLFAVHPKKGLSIELEGWSLEEVPPILYSKNGIDYYCDSLTGFDNVGEKITFTKDKVGNILSAKWGSNLLTPESVFFEKLKKVLI